MPRRENALDGRGKRSLGECGINPNQKQAVQKATLAVLDANSVSRGRKLGKLLFQLAGWTVVVEFLFLLAFLLLVPVFANLFAGLGVDLPIPASWVRGLPVWIILLLALFMPALALVVLVFAIRELVRLLRRLLAERTS